MFEISKKYFPWFIMLLVWFCAYFFYHFHQEFEILFPIIFGSLFVLNTSYLKSYFTQGKLLDIKILILWGMVSGLFLLSGNFYDFLLYLSISVFLFLPLGNYIFFSIGLGLFFLSNILSTFWFLWANELLIYSFYFFILGLFDLPREKYEDYFSLCKTNTPIKNILIFMSIFLFCVSLFSQKIMQILPEIYFVLSVFSSYLKNIPEKKEKKSTPKDILFWHIFIYSLFTIIFIPIIDIYLKIEKKDFIFLIVFSLFTLWVIASNRWERKKKR